MSTNGYTCIRLVFCWINIIFWVSACVVLGIGLWLRIAHEGYATLLPQYAFLDVDALIIALGILAFIFSFLACCGSWYQSRCMLFTYFSMVLFIFVVEITLGALAYFFREDLKHTLSEELRIGILHHYNLTSTGMNTLADVWDDIQSKFGCCGVETYEDWYFIDAWPTARWVPDSCCLPAYYDYNCGKSRNTPIYLQGCYRQINNFFMKRLDLIGFIGIKIAVVQLYGLISSSLLLCTMKHRKLSNTYKSYS
ncbi:unnamed protein product [Callosobruchus maculatus]|uniref:Tetraspanin n=1 Tax=Callosobruchus maculatus TaxID=64391 RepID=A0A653CI63_CALMS|nr:unnamed protein product [Callosobruchus analis]VEN47024.1 unnamed protein product [Callosobruchus maculatus]